jgi:co-chaperonin GroES (HSP10)
MQNEKTKTTYTEQFEQMKADRKEAILKEIEELPLEKDFEPPIGLPVPLLDALFVLPVMQSDTVRASGIKLLSNGDVANDRKMGIVARIGANVDLPIKIGSRVLFENRANHFRIDAADGNEYLLILKHNIFAICTPQTYVVPEFKTKIMKRNEERAEGLKRTGDDAQKVANMSGEEKKELGITTDLLGNRKD